MLTKTNYLTYLQCPKALWLSKESKQLAAVPDESAQRQLDTGQAVDELAREQFPNGRLIQSNPDPVEMARETAAAIDGGAETIFQATFAIKGLLVKVDVLQKRARGWHLIEVKSGTAYKPKEHLSDVAFQVMVLKQAGLSVMKASLMHLNSDYRFPVGDLFTLTNITEDVRKALPQVTSDVIAMRDLLDAQDAPETAISRHCKKPHTCPFYAHCWQSVDGLTIYDIPRLHWKRELPLEDAGILYLKDVPTGKVDTEKGGDDQEQPLPDPLTEKQRAWVDFFVQKRIDIDRATIQEKLSELVYPLYFFDFETIDYAVPVFDGCKPYQQVPFQYSCHVLQADGTLTHYEFLHTDTSDPRRPLAEALLDHIGETGHLVAYNISFERARLIELAAHLPEYADRLTDMADRLWDQLPIFRKDYRDYRFGKSNSLKSVQPVVVPSLSYKTLGVQNGVQAQVAWEKMIGEGDTAVKQEMIAQSLAYCELDTLAMVEIHYKLVAL